MSFQVKKQQREQEASMNQLLEEAIGSFVGASKAFVESYGAGEKSHNEAATYAGGL